MKYMLFAYNNYYPLGGLRDLQARFTDVEDFKSMGSVDSNYDVYQIINPANGSNQVLHLSNEIEELDLDWDKEEEVRCEYINKFVENFIVNGGNHHE